MPGKNINKWVIALTVMIPTLIEIIDISVANVALDHIRGSLSAGLDEATWVLTSYLVSNAVIIPMSGWLARFFGRKKYLIMSILLFTASSILCGASTSLSMLIIFRVLQGIGGGALQPLSQAILLETFPPKEHGMAMAIFGVGAMFGPIAGPLLGGYVTDHLSWRWIFYINGPIGLIAILLVMLFIYDPPYHEKVKGKIDYLGILLLTVGVGVLQFILDRGEREAWFQSSLIVYLLIFSACALILLVIVELFFAEKPILDLRLFKNLSFTSGNLAMFVTFFNLFGSIVLLPLFAQILMGYTAFQAGWILAPGGVVTLLCMPIVGKITDKYNPKYILSVGILLCGLATHLMSKFSLHADFVSIMIPRMVLGMGMAALFIPLTNLTLSLIPKPRMGDATAIYNFLRNLGGSFGIAFSTTMLTRRSQFHHLRLSEQMHSFNETFNISMYKLKLFLSGKMGLLPGVSERFALEGIYGQMNRQAMMKGFNDAFYLLSIFMFMVVFLVFFLRRDGKR
jgi:DHA2 family multidrug resistance protein